MKSILRLRDIIVLGAVALAACAPQPTSTPGAMMEKETPTVDAMMGQETPTADAMMKSKTPIAEATMESSPEAAMPAAEWLGTPMTNVITGQEFKVSDYQGKVVLVETMAVWCTKCRSQQEQIRKLHQDLGDRKAELVSISLDIDPNEDAQYLAAFVAQTGFDWIYAVAPAELSRTLGLTYGNQFLNPPSTPILIIDRHGAAHPLPFGIKSADELRQVIQPYLDESM
jgi:thiol-disulfide isomerase/thioredoxin